MAAALTGPDEDLHIGALQSSANIAFLALKEGRASRTQA